MNDPKSFLEKILKSHLSLASQFYFPLEHLRISNSSRIAGKISPPFSIAIGILAIGFGVFCGILNPIGKILGVQSFGLKVLAKFPLPLAKDWLRLTGSLAALDLNLENPNRHEPKN